MPSSQPAARLYPQDQPERTFHFRITLAAVHRKAQVKTDKPSASVHPTARFTDTGMQGSSTVSRVAMYILHAWQNFFGLPRPAHRIFMRWVVPHFGHMHSMVMPSPH
jgi:hypothetical protein